jgi:hypothetical protein
MVEHRQRNVGIEDRGHGHPLASSVKSINVVPVIHRAKQGVETARRSLRRERQSFRRVWWVGCWSNVTWRDNPKRSRMGVMWTLSDHHDDRRSDHTPLTSRRALKSHRTVGMGCRQVGQRVGGQRASLGARRGAPITSRRRHQVYASVAVVSAFRDLASPCKSPWPRRRSKRRE